MRRSVNVKVCPCFAGDGFQYAHGFADYFGADTVAGEEGDVEIHMYPKLLK